MDVQRLAGEVSDLALQSRSDCEYRRELLRLLISRLGAEHGAVCLATAGGALAAEDSEGLVDGRNRFEELLPTFMKEYPAEVFVRAARPQAQHIDDIYPPAEAERTRLHREYLRPRGVRGYAMRYWTDGRRADWICLAGAGAFDTRRFFSRVLPALDGIFPVLALGARLHTPTGVSGGRADPVAGWARDHGLTAAERRMLAFVERGFTNPEIAGFLGISPNTARNRLAAVFRKLEVSRRSELVYLMGTARADATWFVEAGGGAPAISRPARG